MPNIQDTSDTQIRKIAARIKADLEAAWDIPFTVKGELNNGIPTVTASPENEEEQYFDVTVSIVRNVRLVLSLTPQRYAYLTIQAMGNASEEKKAGFAAFAKLLRERGAKTDFILNDYRCDETDPHTWPENWKTLTYRLTKQLPENPDYVAIMESYGETAVGMGLSLLNIVPTADAEEPEGRKEGDQRRTEINRYERNPVNREICIQKFGYRCVICGFDFEKTYGELGRRYIQVHHKIPVSKMGPGYKVNPLTDMIPVCANCHAMLHRTDPPVDPEKLKEIIRKQSAIKN